MRAALAAAAIAALILVPASTSKPPRASVLLAPEPWPLAMEHAPDLFKQCSREAPVPEGALWLPSRSEVAELERRLVAYFRTVELDKWGVPDSSLQYRGQYAGFARGGRKYIYASYSSVLLDVSLPPDWDDYVREGHSMIGCDGGSHFWGIVYDLASGQFSELKVNGAI